MTAASHDASTHSERAATTSTRPRLVTATSEVITVPLDREGGPRMLVHLPVAAWLLDDGGPVVIISAMAMGDAQIDAAAAVAEARGIWPEAVVLERRPHDRDHADDPRATVADYLELTPRGIRIRPDHVNLERRGMHLSHA